MSRWSAAWRQAWRRHWYWFWHRDETTFEAIIRKLRHRGRHHL